MSKHRFENIALEQIQSDDCNGIQICETVKSCRHVYDIVDTVSGLP